jgi:pimeloyl-ACP methyl ester carboxylesterase
VRSFLASRDRVKGACGASVAAGADREDLEAAKRDDPVVRGSVAEAIERHRAAGREFEAGGVRSFVRERGAGDPVVLMHGIPVSSFLYRKVLPLLAERGLRGVAFDLPGLGLAERQAGFDYTWSGLGRWTGAAIDALGIDHCHLVLHDIGGPVGLEWALRNRERVRSLTVLDTLLKVWNFRRHWTMAVLAPPVVGRLLLATKRGPAARWLFLRQRHRQPVGDAARGDRCPRRTDPTRRRRAGSAADHPRL